MYDYCVHCKGTGLITVGYSRDIQIRTGNVPMYPETKKCPACKGSGKINRVVRTD